MINETQVRIDELKSLLPFVKNAQTIEMIQDAINYKIRFYQSLLPAEVKEEFNHAVVERNYLEPDASKYALNHFLNEIDQSQLAGEIKSISDAGVGADTLTDYVLGENRKCTVIIESKSSEKKFQVIESLIDRAIYYNNKIVILADSMPKLNSNILNMIIKKPCIAKIRETNEFFDNIHHLGCTYLDDASHVFLLDTNNRALKSAIMNRVEDRSNSFDPTRLMTSNSNIKKRTVVLGSDSAKFSSTVNREKHVIVNID